MGISAVKTWSGETERFLWWELVDGWRYEPIAQFHAEAEEAVQKRGSPAVIEGRQLLGDLQVGICSVYGGS